MNDWQDIPMLVRMRTQGRSSDMWDCSVCSRAISISGPTKCQEMPLIIVTTKNNLVKVQSAPGERLLLWRTTEEWELTKQPQEKAPLLFIGLTLPIKGIHGENKNTGLSI